MQFGKEFDHWPTILGGTMVKILGGGGGQKILWPSLSNFGGGGPGPPGPPSSATPDSYSRIAPIESHYPVQWPILRLDY